MLSSRFPSLKIVSCHPGGIHPYLSIWVFPKIVIPQNGWFIMKNPIKMDDLGVALFSETSIYSILGEWAPVVIVEGKTEKKSLLLLSPGDSSCDLFIRYFWRSRFAIERVTFSPSSNRIASWIFRYSIFIHTRQNVGPLLAQGLTFSRLHVSSHETQKV